MAVGSRQNITAYIPGWNSHRDEYYCALDGAFILILYDHVNGLVVIKVSYRTLGKCAGAQAQHDGGDIAAL